MLFVFPNPSWKLCEVCLLVSVVGGAYRQWCLQFWERIEIQPGADDGDNKTENPRLDAYVPGWKSAQFRIGSWAVVAACSIPGAAWATAFLRGLGTGRGTLSLLGILLVRWLLSALIGASAANCILRKKGTGYRL